MDHATRTDQIGLKLSVSGRFVGALVVGAWMLVGGGCGDVPTDVTVRQGAASATPTFVQVNAATPQASSASVAVPFNAAQTAGNFIAVIVGWNDGSTQVTSVSDATGNAYALAIGPTKSTTVLTQSIYYAKNIAAAAAGANVVTVAFSAAPSFPDVRVLEYANIDPTDPLDVAVGASGNGATSDSGSVTTTNANDLLVAGTTTSSGVASVDANYMLRIVTNPDEDDAQDRLVTATGSVNATATLASSDAWVAQMAAFRALPLGADTQPPTAPSGLTATATSSSQVNLTWTAATDDVGVAAYLVERCQDTGCSAFDPIGSATVTTFRNSTLAASTSYTYRVRATDAAGNLSDYSNTASATTPAASATPAFVQVNSAVPQSAPATVALPYLNAQTAGDLNVVVVGWNDSTALVTSVTDSVGNAYALAVGPAAVSGVMSQSIYYAPNIAGAAANANTVTVQFSPAAAFPDVRILEYSGVDATDPLDVIASGQGNDASSVTSAVVTTNAVDLLVGANMVATGTLGADSGYASRVITNPDGDIAEDRVVTSAGAYTAAAPLSSPGAWVMQMVAFRAAGSGTAPPPDTTPPTVTVTSPPSGATLSLNALVTVTATDTSGVNSVQLLVDGAAVGAPLTAAPYQFPLDTTAFVNGAHTIGALGSDPFLNLGAATPVAVTIANQPSQLGAWSAPNPLPIVAVHAALLPGGNVLEWDGQSHGYDARIWNPTTNATTQVSAPSNIFCGAQEQMRDGRILVVGGHVGAHVGLADTNIFDPATGAWTPAPNMDNPRWYPTLTALPDGRVMVLGGESTCNGCNVSATEIFDPTTNAWTTVDAPWTWPYYPHVYVLPDGTVLVASATRAPIVSWVLDLNTLRWSAIGGPAVDGGSSVMYLPGKILKTGTSVDPDLATRGAAATAYVLDTTQASPTWRATAPMNFARTFHSLTVLPDGTVLASGGGPTTAATDTANAVLTAELWSPATETWTLLATMHTPRLYHSQALLLPDGRVEMSGGGRFDDVTAPTDQFSAELFSPPYLFKGPQPTITSAPGTLQYGQPFTVQTPDAARIGAVSLLRYGAATHSVNMGQRYLPLSFTVADAGSITVSAPANANLAPPGNYMLFILDTNGVPSVAATVHF
jgi:hypothetical protein